MSRQEYKEIVRRARQYLRVVRNVADNRDLDHDLSRLEGELRKNAQGVAHDQVFDLAQFRKEQRRKLAHGVEAGPSLTIGATKGRLGGFLRDIGLFAFFVCLLCSVCSLASLF